ncbi:MAG: hypothetical protein ABI806_29270 [Candidatus Solibacter sp.]
MNGKFAIHTCLLGAVLLTGATTAAKADQWNKKTYINTTRSIEVPGAVLPPGRYVFKLLDSSSNRHIVQILNDSESHVFATNLAIPKQRMEPADKTILTFYEMPGGGPEPVRSWIYPGDTIGQEFSYPRRRALEISRMTRQDVPVMAELRSTQPVQREQTPVVTATNPPTTSYENSADRTVVRAETPGPAAEPVETSEAKVSMPEEKPQAAPPATSSNPDPAMPHTAGNTAGIALIGLGCLGIAASLRMAGNATGNRS